MKGMILAANWKMNKTARECYSYFRSFRQAVDGMGSAKLHAKGVRVVICPPYTCLYAAARAAKGLRAGIGSQDLYFERDGPFTGEISARMLKESNVQYAIVGHSERRHVIGETDDIVKKKLRCCLENGLIPILCVGEKLEERKKGLAKKVVRRQLNEALKGVDIGKIPKVIIAYEPVWAISRGDGKGMTARPEDAQEMHSYIRGILLQAYGRQASRLAYIIYGGSVNRQDIKGFCCKKDIDGFLVGGASLDPAHFADLLTIASESME